MEEFTVVEFLGIVFFFAAAATDDRSIPPNPGHFFGVGGKITAFCGQSMTMAVFALNYSSLYV